jgi:hypothetical protein
MAAGTSGGECAALPITAARVVGDADDRLAHQSKLDVVVRDAADVAGPLGRRLADAALRGGEL